MLFNVLFFSILAAVATIVGMSLVLLIGKKINKFTTHLISFAAGILISVAFLHLIPESLEISDYSVLFVLLGFVAFYVIEHFVMLHSCQEGSCENHHIGKVAFLGLTFHSLIDGIIIGLGFEISFGIGVLSTLAVLLHELPEGVASISIMLHSGMKRSKAIRNSIIIAIATPIGAVLSYLFFKNLDANILGSLLALAAGSFIYVAASDLIPEVHKKKNRLSILFFIIGIIFIYFVSYLH
jgi:zinc and cadmium transporter